MGQYRAKVESARPENGGHSRFCFQQLIQLLQRLIQPATLEVNSRQEDMRIHMVRLHLDGLPVGSFCLRKLPGFEVNLSHQFMVKRFPLTAGNGVQNCFECPITLFLSDVELDQFIEE